MKVALVAQLTGDDSGGANLVAAPFVHRSN
jgi:hypothetical protein